MTAAGLIAQTIVMMAIVGVVIGVKLAIDAVAWLQEHRRQQCMRDRLEEWKRGAQG